MKWYISVILLKMEESSSEKFIKSPEEEPLEQNTASTPKTVHLLTPNDDDNDSASELSDGDLVPDRSAECSPMLTPNTIQEAVVGAEESPVPIEDTLRKSALEGLTHDFLHVNLEEEKKDELPTDEEESIPEEQQLPEGILKFVLLSHFISYNHIMKIGN
ncbi:hypothetical protein C0J52_21179 [Blattella germanica]|nr:hypothetical protein C0J52_21179 [Blattella germanica]